MLRSVAERGVVGENSGPEVVDRGLASGFPEGGLGNLLRVLPARVLRWVGMGWLCSAVYVKMNTVGSVRFRSTSFLAGHPLELLHL